MNLSKKRLYDSALTEKGFNISMKYIPFPGMHLPNINVKGKEKLSGLIHPSARMPKQILEKCILN